MGKKKQGKKIDSWIGGDEYDLDDILTAGFGVLADAARRGKKKRFKKARRRGLELLEAELPTVTALFGGEADDLSDPVISYERSGGSWYSVAIDGHEVDRVQGEEDAAARAGELLESYAALDTQDPSRTGVHDGGGGWYDIFIGGVPIDRVQGREEADERYLEVAPVV